MSKTIAILIGFLFSVESFSMEAFNYVDRHLSGSSPLKSSEVIELEDNVWLFFDDVKPNDVIARFAGNVRIKGERMRPDVNCRVLIYRHGAVVVPQSNDDVAFVLYAENGLSGISEEMRSGFYYSNNPPTAAPDSLRKSFTLDNKACSFILRRGYMATLATQSDGMGYSRVFVADTADLVVDDLPDLLSRKVSFVRVLPWQYVSKKGWAGSKWDTMPEGLKYVEEQADFTNSTWFYNWGTSATSTANPRRQGKNYNQEFVPEVWGASSGTTKLYGLTDVCQLMGFNEPDHSEQSNVSVEKEACPLNLAPTSSTMAQLAMGDALAIALIEKRNFQPRDFAQFHPGGELGKRLLTTAQDVMRSDDMPILPPEMHLGEAIILVSKGKLGLGIAEVDGKIVGLITDGDIRRAMEKWQAEFFDRTVSDIMTRTPKTVKPETKITEIQRIMNKYKVHSVLVTDNDNRLLGVVDHYSCMI